MRVDVMPAVSGTGANMRGRMYWMAWGVSRRPRSVERAVTRPKSSSLSSSKKSSSSLTPLFFAVVLAPTPGLRRGSEEAHDEDGDGDDEVAEDPARFGLGRLDKVDEDFFLTRPEPPKIDLRLIFGHEARDHGRPWWRRASSRVSQRKVERLIESLGGFKDLT